MKVEYPDMAGNYARHLKEIALERDWDDRELLFYIANWLSSPTGDYPDLIPYLRQVEPWNG